MTQPTRIQLSRAKGWRMPPNTVKVDRSTKWGNPFRYSDHSFAVRHFREMLSDAMMREFLGYPMSLEDLRGKNLACWCKPGSPCHADVLLELANK